MTANYTLLKFILAPLIILGATLVARRWGENIGGLIVGLPLTSGPVSVFFALEQGHHFAAYAAQEAILGLIPVAAFCIGYVRIAKGLPWYSSALTGVALYLMAVWGISMVTPGFALVGLLVPGVLIAALWILGRPDTRSQSVSAPWWDLPLRMLIATALLFGITTAASALGSKWSGLLSPFPIFTFVMATFSHRQGGSQAAWRFMRGVLSGLFSYVAFFLVVTALVEQVPLWLAYLLATAAALGINGFSLLALIYRRRGETQPAQI